MSARFLTLSASLALQGCASTPAPWDGPVLTQDRAQVTVDQLNADDTLQLLDMSFFARPDWAGDSSVPFSGSVSFSEAEMRFPEANNVFEREDLFPKFTIELLSDGHRLVPSFQGVIDTRSEGNSYWDVFVGTGAVWREDGDDAWSRASFPLSLLGRYVGEVRNCVATFVYDEDTISNAYVQCSQETAVLDADQLGDLRAMVPAAYEPQTFADAAELLELQKRSASHRLPTSPLSEIDLENEIADHFDRSIVTNASTSLGAIYVDGELFVHPPKTRHGTYPYLDEMRHGVFSVTKSMAGALAMFYFAERYGEEIFDEPIADHVPASPICPSGAG